MRKETGLLVVLGMSVALLAGCADLQSNAGLRQSDLRVSNYKYVNNHIYMDLATAQRQLFIHREACDIDFELIIDPEQVFFATVVYGAAGQSDLKDRAMFDLTAFATGKLDIQGYTYYAENKGLVYAFPEVLNKPTVCPDGINTKKE